MGQPSEWSYFYKTLNHIGPRLLRDVHPELEKWIEFEAAETDSFWSPWLEGDFDLWKEGRREEAVRNALEDWLFNVKQHLEGVLGEDSLIPFDSYGVTPRMRNELIASVGDIQLTLDDEHISFFINSVVLDLASTSEAPQLIIQGIIQSYGNTPEGKLIHAVALPWKVIVDALIKDWNIAYQIPHQKWEEMIAAAFDRAGFDEVTLTPRSGDHGRDVIAVKKGIGSIRIIDSVKAYKPGHLVGYDDVRALAGVLLGDLQATKGIITTTSDFAPGIGNDPFLKPLMPYRLELMNRKTLKEWLQGLAFS